MDTESSKQLTEAQHVENMVNSDGWNIVKAKLDAKILDLQNINNLDITAIDTLPAQLAARKMAVDIVFGWLKGDVYGFIEQQRNNLISPKPIDDFIDRN